MTFLQVLISGLAVGGIYALMALGLTAIYRSTTVVNFAHAEAFMLAAFVSVIAIAAGVPYAAAIVLGLLATAILGLLMYRIVFAPLMNADHVTHVFGTIAVGFILTGGVRWLFGSDVRRLPPILDRPPIRIGSAGNAAVIDSQSIIIIVAVLMLTGLLAWLFLKSQLGMILRATTQNQRGAMLVGIEIKKVFAAMWVVGPVLAGLAGILAAPTLLVGPDLGQAPMLLAFAGMALGGFGSFPGAVLGGVLIGVIQTTVGLYISTGFAEASGYLVILVVLLVRPQGIFGTSEVA